MTKWIAHFLLIVVLCLFIAASVLLPILTAFRTIDAIVFGQVRYCILISTYACLLISLFAEKQDLGSFHLDRGSVVYLACAGFARISLRIPNETYLKALVILLTLILIGVSAHNWRRIPGTSKRWASVGLGVVLLAGPLALIESSQPDKYFTSSSLYQADFLSYLVKNLLFNLGFVAPVEEIIFRSILWRRLCKSGISETRTMWLQGTLFWSLHFWQASSALTFFVTIPIITVILTWLVRRSKQLFPALVAHTLLNTLGPVFVYLFSAYT